MATQRKSTVEPYHAETGTSGEARPGRPGPHQYRPDVDGFDVTCVVGRVAIGWESSETVITTPYEAAMLLIARHDAPGVYTFPMPSGGVTRITVEYFDNPDLTYDPDGPGARNKVHQQFPNDAQPA